MVNIHCDTKSLLRDSEGSLAKLAVEMYKQREDVIQKLKGTTVLLKTKEKTVPVKFLDANLTQFKYQGDKTAQWASLSNLKFGKK
jgi:hypothetical protein